jgi:transposase-like protein
MRKAEIGRGFLVREYVENRRSTHDIARSLDTYPNLVRRALIEQGIPLRDRAAAQREALRSGRHPHPTRGRERTGEERARISEGMARALDDRAFRGTVGDREEA